MKLKPPNPAVQEPLILGEFLPYRLSVATERISRLFAARYEQRFGLSIPEWRVLAVLGEAAPRSTQALIETTAMDRVKVSRAVTRLADKGLIARSADPEDQRAQILDLTEKGRATYREIVPLAHALQAALAATLSEEEQRALGAILQKLSAAALAMQGEEGDGA